MRDFRGKGHYVLWLGNITGKRFEEKYNEMSNSPDKLPVASTVLPFDEGRFSCWIFYETKPGAENQPAIEEKKELKLVL